MKFKAAGLAETICRNPLCFRSTCLNAKCTAHKYAERAISAEYRPERHSYWIKVTQQKAYTDKNGNEAFRSYTHYRCSRCSKSSAVPSPFCPECGAMMEISNV